MNPADHESLDAKKKFLHEATRLALESVDNGWGGPFGAVIVRNGEIIGRGQNRVLLTGIPVYHAEITAIIDACSLINSKFRLSPILGEGTLKLIPRPSDSPDVVPERAQMLKGCDIYVNGAPCPMCMSAISWARIDRLYFGARLADASSIGFDDEFQHIDFNLPWKQRRAVRCFPDFERDHALKAFDAWKNKSDRHPY
jgi:tRNA(Arg) A34 adenosine deaminase TadA